MFEATAEAAGLNYNDEKLQEYVNFLLAILMLFLVWGLSLYKESLFRKRKRFKNIPFLY